MSHRFVSGLLVFQLGKENGKACVQCFQHVPLCNLNYYQTDPRVVKRKHLRENEINHSPVLHATERVLERCRQLEVGMDPDGCVECRRAQDYMQNVWGRQFQMNLDKGFQCHNL